VFPVRRSVLVRYKHNSQWIGVTIFGWQELVSAAVQSLRCCCETVLAVAGDSF
jgi:hypothetical protein